MDTQDYNEEEDDVIKPKAVFGVRHFQAFMLFLGMVLIYCIRVCMSMAIVSMTDRNQNDTFTWDLKTQSIILSSFNWGYLLLQIPGGELAARFGGMALLSCCLGVNSLMALLIPAGAHYGGWTLVCLFRFIQGLIQGFLNPSVHNLMSKWVPKEERSRLGTFIYAGSHLGTALQLVSAGFVAEFLGWPGIFYVNGSLGMAWTVLYVFVGANSPDSSKIISAQERNFIRKSLGQTVDQKMLSEERGFLSQVFSYLLGSLIHKPKTPWRALLTSLPFYALVFAHAGSGFGYWTLLYEIPTYQKKVLHVDIKANGMMAALPWMVAYVMSFAFGFVSDYVIVKNWFSITTCRKVSNSCGAMGPAAALLVLAFAPPDVTTALSVLVLAFALKSGTITGFNLIPLDMAPNFAGTLIGISGTVTNIVGLNAPLVTGALIQDDTSPSEWRKVFLLATTVYVVCNTFFLMFATSERQPWNEPVEKHPEDVETLEEKENILQDRRT